MDRPQLRPRVRPHACSIRVYGHSRSNGGGGEDRRIQRRMGRPQALVRPLQGPQKRELRKATEKN